MDAEPLATGGRLPMEGVVDYRDRPITSRSNSGGWTSAIFIIGVEIAERFAYYGVASNLITYLTGPLGESTASAAANVNAWSGAASMLPLIGGILADSYVGRYRTIVFASILYVLGLGMLTLSAVAPFLRPPRCSNTIDSQACLPTQFQVAFFYFSVYLVAFAQGGHKPCVQAFGADQFDENDPEECKSKSSFFNWWYFGMCFGTAFTLLILNYVQDYVSWGLGFGMPCVSMVIALVIFLMGTRTYRFYVLSSKGPFTELLQVCGKMWKNLQNRCSSDRTNPHKEEAEAKEALLPKVAHSFRSIDGSQCSSLSEQDNEECRTLQEVFRLFPIWATCLIYAVVFAQSSTFFTKQGSTMDRRITPTFLVPPAALQSYISFSIVAFVPIYDRVIVPTARRFTGIPSGVTMLQRIGIGMLLSVVAMVIAALVEMKRLQTAKDFGLIDQPKAMVPLSLWWLVPQYIMYGISEAFTMVGLQEFFYDQVPDGLRSIGLALYLSIFGIGSFISSFLVSAIDKVSRRSGESWFSDNLNRAHLDYFYWLLAVLSAVQLLAYLHFARAFRYKRKGLDRECAQMWNALKNRFSSNRMSPGTKQQVMEAKESLLQVGHQVDPWSVDDYQYSSLSKQDNKECKVEMMQELLMLFPIGASCLMFAVGLSQISTLFTKQGSTLDRRIGQAFLVPPAALQSIIGLSIIIFLPIYDRVIVPLTKSFTGELSGITVLQRVGVGLLLSVVAMVVAALVEMRRLQMARDFGLMYLPKATVPMSLWWLLLQYLLNGISDAFVSVGLQEFFKCLMGSGALGWLCTWASLALGTSSVLCL